MNNLTTRLLSAFIMLPVAVGIILYGGLPYLGLMALAGGLILYEWNGICEGRTPWPLFLVQVGGLMALAWTLHDGVRPGGEWIGAYVAGVIVAALVSRAAISWAVLGMVYAALPVLGLIYLRHFVPQGALIVLWMMIIVWSMDSGAYFAGKNIGGPKMAPRISPNKTWAGLIGGVAAAGLLGTFAAAVMGFSPLGLLAGAAALLGLWSQMGDLAESALKRHFKVKDSGTLIPGHGGLMDRVDGVIFVAPVLAGYYYFTL